MFKTKQGEVKEETDHISDHEGLDKLCLIVENEKFYTENPPEQSKRKNEVGEGSKVVVQRDSAKSTCDLYSKVMEQTKKYEEKGKNPVADNKTLESNLRKSEILNRRLTRGMISLSVPRTIERSCEPIVVEDNCNNEDESPPRETPINEYE